MDLLDHAFVLKEQNGGEGNNWWGTLPTGTKMDDVVSGGVCLWDVKRLKRYFPLEKEGLENVMAAFTTIGKKDSHVEALSKYNKLIGDRGVILANTNRKPGGGGETRAYFHMGITLKEEKTKPFPTNWLRGGTICPWRSRASLCRAS